MQPACQCEAAGKATSRRGRRPARLNALARCCRCQHMHRSLTHHHSALQHCTDTNTLPIPSVMSSPRVSPSPKAASSKKKSASKKTSSSSSNGSYRQFKNAHQHTRIVE